MVCKEQVGHALSVPDREKSHLLSEDLGSGEPVSRASAQKIITGSGDVIAFHLSLLQELLKAT